ncbi:MAG: hypothetical protein ACI9WU_004209, partial [Myxococcota bacterium]
MNRFVALTGLMVTALCSSAVAAPVSTIPSGDFNGDGLVNSADFQCLVRLNVTLQFAADGAPPECLSDIDCGAKEACSPWFGPTLHCVPDCLSDSAILGEESVDPPCAEGDEDEVCSGPVAIDNVDLNCDGSIGNADFQLLITLILGGGVGPGSPDHDSDGVLNWCDPDTDGDGDPDETDCAPLDPMLHSAAVEQCDGADNDCNLLIDALDPSLESPACELTDGVCASVTRPPYLCVNGEWLACPATLYDVGDYEDPEVTCDGKDNDCDGQADNEDADVVANCCASISDCPPNASCSSSQCACDQGYQGDGFSCANLDECQLQPCGPNMSCTDSIGSFDCDCVSDFFQDAADCVPCSSCPPGTFVAASCASDADTDCDPCDSSCLECAGALASECTDCSSGFQLTAGACQDVDECAGLAPCAANTICINQPGSFDCACATGFWGDGQICTACTVCGPDQYELSGCLGPDDAACGPCDATCTACAGPLLTDCLDCPSGFQLQAGACIDTDECTSPSSCHNDAQCVNLAGTFTCTCSPGFFGDGQSCAACSPCLADQFEATACTTTQDSSCGPCDASCTACNGASNADCTDCPAGFALSSGQCQDINECDAPGSCHLDADCLNLPGSFTCTCQTGFFGDGQTCAACTVCAGQQYEMSSCTATDNGACGDCDSSCAACTGLSSAECTDCPSGFALVAGACQDVDECETAGTCHANATCQNTIGSFECSCLGDFFGDGQICTACTVCSSDQHEITACTPAGNTSCGPCDASCAGCSGPSSSDCTGCPSGFSLTAGQCQDVNECDVGETCDANAACLNTAGSFVCTCQSDFFGNGQSCDPCATCEPDQYGSTSCGPTTDRICADCDPGCTTCEGPSASECTECPLGFDLTDGQCLDIDECAAPDACHAAADCENTAGDFVCTCQPGWAGDGQTCSACTQCQGDEYETVACTPTQDRECAVIQLAIATLDGVAYEGGLDVGTVRVSVPAALSANLTVH